MTESEAIILQEIREDIGRPLRIENCVSVALDAEFRSAVEVLNEFASVVGADDSITPKVLRTDVVVLCPRRGKELWLTNTLDVTKFVLGVAIVVEGVEQPSAAIFHHAENDFFRHDKRADHIAQLTW